jgi:cytochrome c peroxidase
VRTLVFRNPNGSETRVPTPDPGRALITGRVEDVNVFKISSLWGVRRTAPYFHDNSARTLEDVAAHYDKFFAVVIPGNPLTVQDQADIVA